MTTADPNVIMADAAKLHIDLEYESVPVFINNFNMNMDEYLSFGNVVTPKQFLDKIAEIMLKNYNKKITFANHNYCRGDFL